MRNFKITVMDVANLGMLEASVHCLSTTKVLYTVFILARTDLAFWIKTGNSDLKALTWLEFLKEETTDSSPPFSNISNTQVNHLPQETNQNTPPTSLKSNPQAILPTILASTSDTSHPNPISPSPHSHSLTTKLLPNPITTQNLSDNTLQPKIFGNSHPSTLSPNITHLNSCIHNSRITVGPSLN